MLLSVLSHCSDCGENVHGIFPIVYNNTCSGYLSSNQHSVRVPVVPTGRKGQGRFEEAMDIKWHGGSVDREISCHLCKALNHCPNNSRYDHEGYANKYADPKLDQGDLHMNKGAGPAKESVVPVPTKSPVPMLPPSAISWICLLFRPRCV